MIKLKEDKSEGITIQIKNNSTKKSKSFTVYGETIEVAYTRLLWYYECFEQGKEVIIEK